MTHTSCTLPNPTEVMRNVTYDQIQVGHTAVLQHTVTERDVHLFAVASGDINPAHMDPEYAASSMFKTVIAHGMYGAALISALLGTRFPGPGTIYLGQTLRFSAPVRLGDELTIKLTVTAKDDAKKWIKLDCQCSNQKGKVVISGEAEVIPPAQYIEWQPRNIPQVDIRPTRRSFDGLVRQAVGLGAIKVAVAYPCDAVSLQAALDAAAEGLIAPVLVGPRARIEQVARDNSFDIAALAIEDCPDSVSAAQRAAALARDGVVQAIMKGSLHTDELMAAVVARDAGLRTARRISHSFLMESTHYPRPFIITDAAVNIAPDLAGKADIVRNAIDVAHAIGVAVPKVALLAAVESINPAMQATLDAAALCKMADRGQITGAVLDGPLAFDNAVSVDAARTKGITSPVAGQADVLVVPNLESGNMLFKGLSYLGGAKLAGVVSGAKVPVILTSRADSQEARVASCALAVLLAHHQKGAKA